MQALTYFQPDLAPYKEIAKQCRLNISQGATDLAFSQHTESSSRVAYFRLKHPYFHSNQDHPCLLFDRALIFGHKSKYEEVLEIFFDRKIYITIYYPETQMKRYFSVHPCMWPEVLHDLHQVKGLHETDQEILTLFLKSIPRVTFNPWEYRRVALSLRPTVSIRRSTCTFRAFHDRTERTFLLKSLLYTGPGIRNKSSDLKVLSGQNITLYSSSWPALTFPKCLWPAFKSEFIACLRQRNNSEISKFIAEIQLI